MHASAADYTPSWHVDSFTYIYVYSGAVALGQGVASTIRKGIVDVDQFANYPELLMFGNWCSVVGAAAWVAIATVFSLPVSSTHAVIGSILVCMYVYLFFFFFFIRNT